MATDMHSRTRLLLTPLALAGLLVFAGCGGPAVTPGGTDDPGTGSDGATEPGIATSCPDGLLDTFAEFKLVDPVVTEVDARAALDAIGLETLSPAPSCFGEIEHSGGTYSIGFWIGAEPAFLDYVVDQMQLAGYEWSIDEANVKSFIGQQSGQAETVFSEAVPVGGWTGVSDVAGIHFVTIEFETLVP